MADRPPPHHRRPDEAPRFAASDHPLSLSRRAPGPGGLAGKIGLAALGLILMFAITAAFWVAMVLTHRDDLQPPDTHVEIEER